jgi:hypothetical protein
MDKLVNDRKKTMEKLPEDHLPLSLLDVFDPMYNISLLFPFCTCVPCATICGTMGGEYFYIYTLTNQ